MRTAEIFQKHQYALNQVTLLQSGAPFFTRLLQLLGEAQTTIHVQYYIVDLDQTGQQVLQALKAAAARGVQVFMLVDAYASAQVTKAHIMELATHGIKAKRFSPLKTKKGYGLGRRMHHKICWVDGHTALIGGINLADKYSGFNGKIPWLDFAVEITGPACTDVLNVCEELLPNRWMRQLQPPQETQPQGSCLSRISQNDWLRYKAEISRSYRHALRTSTTSLVIVASYFFPGNRMRRLIKAAAKRGVNITVILGGFSDVPLMKSAITYLYDWLLRNNVTIYEWQPSVLHAKLAIVDEEWVTIGSYNLNALSDYGSLELNVEVQDTLFAKTTKQHLQQLINEGCHKIEQQDYLRNKSWYIQLWRWFSYKLLRLSLRLLFLVMQGRKPSSL